MGILAASAWLDKLVNRPGHEYWNSRTLDSKDFLYSYVAKNKPMQMMEPVTIADADGVIGSSLWLAEYGSCANANTNTLTTDTAPNLIANLGFTVDSDSFDVVINNGSAANVLTIAAGSGVTAVGNLVIPVSRSRRFRLRRASATTCTLYSL
tara:strand:+ start:741 stop:1196 length:456 start_codon:yes stop_codon:yes gene_type:complete